MGRPRTNDETVKERLVAAATELFATRSRESVTVRALAESAGTATAAVYTLFGSKDALIDEVRDRAVGGLFQVLSGVPESDDPVADIHALAVAYRGWAREHTHLYTVLFGGVQNFDPTGAVGSADPVGPLLRAIDRALVSSRLIGEATSIALSIWVTLHGLVTLEIAGAFDAATAQATLETAIPAALRGWSTAAG